MLQGSIRERLAMLSRGELIGLVVALAVTLGGAGLWYARSLPKPVQVRASTHAATASPSASRDIVPLVVDVAGAVRRPGVYEFREGDRIVDAIRAAGGATRRAALDGLNLAAPLTDGVQILVPEVPPVGATEPGPIAGEGPAALVNVNSASATELEVLPGVGEVIAQAIVDYRTDNGPFATVDDLLDVSGIGDATLEDIRDLVTV